MTAMFARHSFYISDSLREFGSMHETLERVIKEYGGAVLAETQPGCFYVTHAPIVEDSLSPTITTIHVRLNLGKLLKLTSLGQPTFVFASIDMGKLEHIGYHRPGLPLAGCRVYLEAPVRHRTGAYAVLLTHDPQDDTWAALAEVVDSLGGMSLLRQLDQLYKATHILVHERDTVSALLEGVPSS